jgi:hypothetical protein
MLQPSVSSAAGTLVLGSGVMSAEKVIDQVPLKSKLESLRLEVVVLFLTLKG